MFNNSLKMCLIALLTLGLAFTTACGGDDDDKNNKTNNAQTDTGGGDDKDTGGGDKDTDGTGGDKDTDDGDKDTDGTGGDHKTACEGDNAPDRCTADPATFEFGVGSVLSKLTIVGGEDDACCFDFDGDGELDNALGDVLGLGGFIPTVNESLADNIADGTLTIVLEHEGLTELTGGDFTINFFLGLYDTEGALKINPASIDAGTQPLAFLPGAKLTSTGSVTAGPGNVILNLELFGTALELSIREAKISASVDVANSSLEEGVSLTTGKLGGLVIINEVFDAVNKVAETCDCLGLAAGTKLIDYSGEATCANVSANTCEAESTCKTVGDNCGVIALAGSFADQDYAGGELNALSIGATFEAKAAVIDGIAAE